MTTSTINHRLSFRDEYKPSKVTSNLGLFVVFILINPILCCEKQLAAGVTPSTFLKFFPPLLRCHMALSCI